MKTTFRNVLTVAICAAMAFAFQTTTSAQEDAEVDVIIVNQDGEEVEGAIEGRVRIVQADDGEEGWIGKVTEGSSVQIDDDRIIITGPDGEEREIDISGAQSVSVSQAVQSVNENGEQRTIRTGKAIIIDAEGKRHVIPLGEGGGDFEFDMQMMPMPQLPDNLRIIVDGEGMPGVNIFEGLPGRITAQMGDAGGYRIGVVCEPVNEQLRAHLDIDPDVGLVVHSVPEGPAADEGVQKHDVLIYADDTELKTLEDLTKVIQVAGEDEQSISITALRNGREISFDITPEESTGNEAGIIFGNVPMNLEMQRIGPGIIIGEGGMPDFEPFNDDQFQERIEQQIQRMQEQHQRMIEQHQQMMEEFEQRFRDDG